jgi:alkanesulfonate monooxygenase SsuD/methylene tetrahydromethanopterin reductase-like flavin-dependent oxidoreductase (luciferase family)
MTLRFGTYTEFQSEPHGDHAKIVWDHIEVGVQADQLGFDVFTCLEHPWFEQFAIMTDPLQLFALMSQRTRNIRFRALCHTLTLHNPMVLAGEIALADILLHGRLEVGLGRGHAWLMDPANVVLDESVERYPEAVEILLKSWTEDRFSFDGKYYKADNLQVVPKPLQKPHPPIWQVGTSAKWVERAVRNGWGVALGGPAPNVAFEEPIRKYHEACEAVGMGSNFAYIKACCIDEDNDRAIEEGRTYLTNFVHFNVAPTDSLDRSPEGKQRLMDARYEFYAMDDFPNTRNLSYEQLLEMSIVYAGSPDRVAEQLIALLDQFRFDEFLLIASYGGNARWQAMRNQELFMTQIAPKMREAAAKMGKKSAVAAA